MLFQRLTNVTSCNFSSWSEDYTLSEHYGRRVSAKFEIDILFNSIVLPNFNYIACIYVYTSVSNYIVIQGFLDRCYKPVLCTQLKNELRERRSDIKLYNIKEF